MAVLHITGECRIRTCEGISHQIYSLTRLTASVTPPAMRRSLLNDFASDRSVRRLRSGETNAITAGMAIATPSRFARTLGATHGDINREIWNSGY